MPTPRYGLVRLRSHAEQVSTGEPLPTSKHDCVGRRQAQLWLQLWLNGIACTAALQRLSCRPAPAPQSKCSLRYVPLSLTNLVDDCGLWPRKKWACGTIM